MILIDLQEAFDTINHEILINKTELLDFLRTSFFGLNHIYQIETLK